MHHTEPPRTGDWGAQNSQLFIDYGRYFVPEREAQNATICDLIPPRDEPFNVVELCCGAGLLAGALLERFPQATVHGYDGSPEMLDHAQKQLAPYGSRFQTQLFDLADTSWRTLPFSVYAVVSSLAIHHLDGVGKQALFHDVYAMLDHGGVFVIADLIVPADERGVAVAAQAWDDAVRERAMQLDGNGDAFAFFEREHWNMYRYFDPHGIDQPSHLLDQLRWLEAAGFVGVDTYWMRAGHAIFGGQK